MGAACSASQPDSARSPGVVVSKRRTAVFAMPFAASRIPATTLSLCTSSPAQRG